MKKFLKELKSFFFTFLAFFILPILLIFCCLHYSCKGILYITDKFAIWVDEHITKNLK